MHACSEADDGEVTLYEGWFNVGVPVGSSLPITYNGASSNAAPLPVEIPGSVAVYPALPETTFKVDLVSLHTPVTGSRLPIDIRAVNGFNNNSLASGDVPVAIAGNVPIVPATSNPVFTVKPDGGRMTVLPEPDYPLPVTVFTSTTDIEGDKYMLYEVSTEHPLATVSLIPESGGTAHAADTAVHVLSSGSAWSRSPGIMNQSTPHDATFAGVMPTGQVVNSQTAIHTHSI